MQWTAADYRTVSIVTLGNGLWLGTLVWLVFGLWLDLVSFIPCWIGATVVSWPVAISRVGRAVALREEIEEEIRAAPPSWPIEEDRP